MDGSPLTENVQLPNSIWV